MIIMLDPMQLLLADDSATGTPLLKLADLAITA